MARRNSSTAPQGFLLVEALLGIAILSIFLTAAVLPLLYGQENTVLGGDRQRAAYVAEQAIEGVRAIRAASFSSLTAGAHGIVIDENGQWALSGTSAENIEGIRSSVLLTQIEPDWVQAKADAWWKRGYNRSGTQTLYTDFVDWKTPQRIGRWSAPVLLGSYTDPGTPMFNAAAARGEYLYVASYRDGGGGKGLYIFNVSSDAPVRVNTSFDLEYAAYDLTVAGSMLYVTTSDMNAELKAYNISDPQNPVLVQSENVEGCARARGVAVYGSTLVVTALQSDVTDEHEFYTYRVQTPVSTTLQRLDTADDDATLYDVSLVGTGGLVTAYVATSGNSRELSAYRITESGTTTLLGSSNLTDRTQDGRAIVVMGTSALLGTDSGNFGEVALFDTVVQGNIPPQSAPGPWYKEGSGSVYGIAADPSRCYTFFAAQTKVGALRIANFHDLPSFPTVATYDSATGFGRGVFYNSSKDRLVLLTDADVHYFKPSDPPNDCE